MLTASEYLYIYIVSVPIFFAIDMVWLGVVAQKLYQSQLGYLLGPVQWPVAITFYLLFLIGLLIFAIAPAVVAKSMMHAVIYGALFGFFTYATYDLTNWATVRDWPWLISIVDMLWGTVLAAAVSVATYSVAVTYIVK
jgi:uncharacterized membrane protein